MAAESLAASAKLALLMDMLCANRAPVATGGENAPAQPPLHGDPQPPSTSQPVATGAPQFNTCASFLYTIRHV